MTSKLSPKPRGARKPETVRCSACRGKGGFKRVEVDEWSRFTTWDLCYRCVGTGKVARRSLPSKRAGRR